MLLSRSTDLYVLAGMGVRLLIIPTLTIDHVVPQAKGGQDNLENLQLLCGWCNSIKGTKTQAEFLATLKREKLTA